MNTDRVDNDTDYTNAHERRKRRWSEAERRLRKERRHPREYELNEGSQPKADERYKS